MPSTLLRQEPGQGTAPQEPAAPAPLVTTNVTPLMTIEGQQRLVSRLHDRLQKQTAASWLLGDWKTGDDATDLTILGLVASNLGLRDSGWEQAYATLSKEQQGKARTAYHSFQAFQAERAASPYAPQHLGAFGAVSGQERSELLLSALKRDDEISRQVWDDYIVPQLGPDAQQAWIEGRQLLRQAVAADALGSVATLEDPASQLGPVRQALARRFRGRNMGPAEDMKGLATMLAAYRGQVEKLAAQEGIPFEEAGELPLNHFQWAAFFRDANALAVKTMTSRRGREVGELLYRADDLQVQAADVLMKTLGTLDYSQFGVGGDRRALKVKDALAVMERVASGEYMDSAKVDGKADTTGLLMRILLVGDRPIGAVIDGITKDLDTAFWVMPDGSVYDDPILLGHRLESDLRSIPDAVWEESRELREAKVSANAQAVEDAQDRLGPLAGYGYLNVAARSLMLKLAGETKGVPIKPTAFITSTRNPLPALQTLSNAGRAIVAGEGKGIMEAIYEDGTAGMAPDDGLGRAAVGVVAFGAGAILDPFNAVSGGYLSGAQLARRYRGLVGTLRKAGVEVPEAVAAKGMDTLEAIGKRLEGSQEVADVRQVIKMPDGTRLARWAVPQYNLLTAMFRGNEDLARTVMQAVKDNPKFLQEGFEATLMDPAWQNRWFHLLAQKGVKVASPAEAAQFMRDAMPSITKVLDPTTQLDWVGRFRNWARVSRDTESLAAAYEHGRGLYISRLGLNTSQVGDAIRVGLRLGDQLARAVTPKWLLERGEIAINALQKMKGSEAVKGLSSAADWVRQRGRALQSVFTLNVVPLQAGKTKVYERVPYILAEAVHRARLANQTTETTLQVLQASWLVDKTGDALLPHAREALQYMRDYAQGATPIERWQTGIRGLAFAEKAVPKMGVLRALKPEDRASMLDDLWASISPEDLTRAESRVNAYRDNFEALHGIFGEGGVIPTLGARYGLFQARAAYAPRIYQGLAEDTDLLALFHAEGLPVALAKKKGRQFSTAGSIHNWQREIPTTVEAMALGLDPVTDLAVSAQHRIQAALDDAARAELLNQVTAQYGVLGMRGAVAAGRLAATNIDELVEYEKAVPKLLEQAKEFATERKALFEDWRQMVKDEKVLADIKAKNPDFIHNTWLGRQVNQHIRLRQIARNEAVAQFAEKYELAIDDVERLVNTTAPNNRMRLMGLRNHLRKTLSGEILTESGKKIVAHRLEDTIQSLSEYQEAKRTMRSLGMTAGEVAPVLMRLYGVPSVDLLKPGDLRAFMQGNMARLGAYIDNPLGPGFSKLAAHPMEAARAYIKDREWGSVFAKATSKEINEFGKRMSNVYLPAEVLLILNSYGPDWARKANPLGLMVGAAVYEQSRGIVQKLYDMVNRGYKGVVTVWNPSLHFMRRNQMDAFSKMFMHSGSAVVSPQAWSEFKAFMRGELEEIIQGTGGAVNARYAREQMQRYLWQSFELPLDIRKAVFEADELADIAKAGEKIGKRAAATAAQLKGKFRPFSTAVTAGTMPKGVELLFGYGAGAAERMDNLTRSWIAFQEIKAGRGVEQGIFRALHLGRDWTNLTPIERILIRQPILFYNFHKQNLKSVAAFLEENPARAAWWPKYVEFSQRDMPEEMRQDWVNKLEAVPGQRGMGYLALDLAATGVLDPFLTVATGGTFQAAGEELVGQMTPAWQIVFGRDLEALGSVRLPHTVAKQIYETVGPMDNALMTVRSEGGRVQVELNGMGQTAAGLLGIGVIANSLGRGLRRAELGHTSQAILDYLGLIKTYDYTVESLEFSAPVAEQVQDKVLRAMPELSENGFGQVVLEDDVDLKTRLALEWVIGSFDAMQQILGGIRALAKLFRPTGPRMKEEK